MSITNDGSGFDADLYGGGRRGMKRNLDDYGGGGSDDDDDDGRSQEAKAKKQRNKEIKDEFDRRKGKISRKEEKVKEREKQKDEEEALRSAKVKAAEFTTKKIAGLDVRSRESYLALLESVLRTNYDKFSEFGVKNDEVAKLHSLDIRQCAVDQEYKVFSDNKVVTTYRRSMAFLMSKVKKDTDAWELHSSLKEFTPSENGFPEEEKNNQPSIIEGFQSALELSKKQTEPISSDKKPEPIRRLSADKKSQHSDTKKQLSSDKKQPNKMPSSDKKHEPNRRPSSEKIDKFKSKLKQLGLSESDSDDCDKEGPPGLNFYCDTANGKAKAHQMSESERSSSSSPNLSDIEQKTADDEHANLVAWLEESEREKEEERRKEEVARQERIKQRELEEKRKEEERLKEEMRRKEEDKPWDVSKVPSLDVVVKSQGGQSAEDERQLSKLEQTIKKVQQQMAEGDDHIQFELKEKNEKPKKPLPEKKPSPTKIKVRVELGSKHEEKTDKNAKKAAADVIVKLLLPHFKSGKIGSKQVFKYVAREFTHTLLDCNKNNLDSYPKYVEKFFGKISVLATESEANNKIQSFKRALKGS